MRPTLRGMPPQVIFQNFSDLSLKQSTTNASTTGQPSTTAATKQTQSSQQQQSAQKQASQAAAAANTKTSTAAAAATHERKSTSNKNTLSRTSGSKKNLLMSDLTSAKETDSSTNAKMRNEFIPQRSVSGLIPKLMGVANKQSPHHHHHHHQRPKNHVSESAPETPKSTIKVCIYPQCQNLELYMHSIGK